MSKSIITNLIIGATISLGCAYAFVASPSFAEKRVTKPASISTPTAAKSNTAKSNTIVGVASGNKSFSTLVTAVKAAGLVETLSGRGPFTVFAPTNEAFKALPKGTLDTLLKPENRAKLVRVLTYHVVPGKVMAKDVRTGNVRTVQGSNIAVKATGGKVMVNNANVTMTDIAASNGVIHVIDRVILPPSP